MTSDTTLPVELLPCPFCRNELAIIRDYDGDRLYAHPDSESCVLSGTSWGADEFDVTAWNTRALSATRTAVTPTHRHKKRGSEYVLIGMGKVQAENWHSQAPGFAFSVPVPVDMREVAIYRDIKDGSLWARPREEFEDGRFEPLSTTEGE